MPTEHFLTNTSRKRPAGFIPPILNQSGVPIKGKVFPEKDVTINGRVSEIEMILLVSGASRRVLKLFLRVDPLIWSGAVHFRYLEIRFLAYHVLRIILGMGSATYTP